MCLQWTDINCLIEMSQMAFNHLLSLSLSFHLRRKTGEILRILDRGAAINRIFELLLFNILPVFIDIFVAIGVFIWKFDWVLGFLVAFVMAAYSKIIVHLNSIRTNVILLQLVLACVVTVHFSGGRVILFI